MGTRVIVQDRFPDTWSDLYGLGYGELHTLLCGLLSGEISREEGIELLGKQADAQHERVMRMTEKLLQRVWGAVPPK